MVRWRGRGAWLACVKGVCKEAELKGGKMEGAQQGKKVFPTFVENTIKHTHGFLHSPAGGADNFLSRQVPEACNNRQ